MGEDDAPCFPFRVGKRRLMGGKIRGEDRGYAFLGADCAFLKSISSESPLAGMRGCDSGGSFDCNERGYFLETGKKTCFVSNRFSHRVNHGAA